jgi:hypothetical protein
MEAIIKGIGKTGYRMGKDRYIYQTKASKKESLKTIN